MKENFSSWVKTDSGKNILLISLRGASFVAASYKLEDFEPGKMISVAFFDESSSVYTARVLSDLDRQIEQQVRNILIDAAAVVGRE